MPKRTKKKREPVTYAEDWYCDTCKMEILEGRSAMVEHMKSVHAMPAECKAQKKLVLAMDMADSYSNTTEWTWPTLNVKATQRQSGPRDHSWGG